MAESVGGDVLGQVLQAIQILSEQMKGLGERLDARMDKLEARMDKQHERLERLGLEFMNTRDEVKQLRLEVQQTREEVQQVRKDLGADMQAVRKQMQTDLLFELGGIRTELTLGSRQMNDRIDRNIDALNLMVSGLHRNTAERFEPVEQRLKTLEAR
jgi:chromosome segregation ATPase